MGDWWEGILREKKEKDHGEAADKVFNVFSHCIWLGMPFVAMFFAHSLLFWFEALDFPGELSS